MKMVIFIVDYNNKTCYGKILSYSIEICFYPKIGIDSSCIVYKGKDNTKKELTISTLMREFYWTDSKVVLGYIRNEPKRFKVLWQTESNSWEKIQMWISGDILKPKKIQQIIYTSCGLTPSYSKKVKRCKSGPKFLWEEESKWPNLEDRVPDIANEDWEVKTAISINAIRIEGDILSNMVEQISSWKKLLQMMAFVMKFVKRMKKISAMEVNQMFWLLKIWDQQKS